MQQYTTSPARPLLPLIACTLLIGGIPSPASAQVLVVEGAAAPRVNQHRVPTTFRVASVDINASVRDQVAHVQLAQTFENTSRGTIQASMLFPLPTDAAIDALTLIVDGKELPGRLLKKAEARRIYESIVRKRQDPALLEYMGQGVFQTRVFPIPPRAKRRIEIRYSQLLRKDSGLVDLHLPLGTLKHSYQPIRELNIAIRIASKGPLKTVFSPTHEVDIKRPDDHHATGRLTLHNVTTPDDLRLFYGTKDGLVGMNLVSFRPNPKQDGYFLLLASPEVKLKKAQPLPKSVVFVIDRSGSMNGKKIEQARDALKYLVERLGPKDSFNIVAYDTTIETFRPELQRVDEETQKAAVGFVEGLFAGGSTNIDGALTTALGMLVDKKQPSYVLFLTDGLPTVGEKNELKIAAHARDANRVNARLFSFGVGFDVNSRLLDRLSREHRGQSVYVRPNENIEVQVSKLYDRIGSPLLTDLAVTFGYGDDKVVDGPAPIARTYPRVLTDLSRGEQLVWVGRYRRAGDVKVTLLGTNHDKQLSFSLEGRLETTSSNQSNGFVAKLWALRRIGEIIDELDLHGTNQELIDELVRLSIDHGVMTPYTSFLADEDVDLASEQNVLRARGRVVRELAKTDGEFGFAQRRAKGKLQRATTTASDGFGGGAADVPAPVSNAGTAPGKQRNVDPSGSRQTIRNIGQKSFFRKNSIWRDSSVTPVQERTATRITQYSQHYFDLAATNGGRLAKYLAFNEPVLINLGGKTYLIEPPAGKR